MYDTSDWMFNNENQLLREEQALARSTARRIASPATRIDLDLWMKTLPRPRGRGDGSDHVHRLDLRSPQTACSRP